MNPFITEDSVSGLIIESTIIGSTLLASLSTLALFVIAAI